MTAFDAMIEAKAAREVVRDSLLKCLRLGGSATEIAGLLRADELAGANLKIALDAYAQINDFTRCTSEHA